VAGVDNVNEEGENLIEKHLGWNEAQRNEGEALSTWGAVKSCRINKRDPDIHLI
jgi:hypothetical protein